VTSNQVDAQRSVILSAGALALSAMGDALIYVVLPVSAAAFNVSLIWVGILLAANRIVRIFFYGGIASLGEIVGSRKLAIIATISAAVSTFMLWGVSGGPALLVARVIWGLAFAGLSLSVLAYAVADRAHSGSRVGISRSIHQIGPALALSAGAWLASQIGPRDIFLVLGIISLFAIPLAVCLPKPTQRPPRKKTKLLPRPESFDLFFFIVGFTVDGIFVILVPILLSQTVSIEAATITAGLILTARRLGEMLFAPLAGRLGDSVGHFSILILSSLILTAGFALLAYPFIIVGSGLVILGRGAIAAVGPAAIADIAGGKDTLHRLAVMQTWRDVGAAVGPLLTGIALDQGFSISLAYIGLAVLTVLSLFSLIGLYKHKPIN